MLRINLFEGSHPDDVCDYCRKQTGEEVISLQLSGRRHSEMYSIQVHTKCLIMQVCKRSDSTASVLASKFTGRN